MAVLLGLAAVFAVNRSLAKASSTGEDFENVVFASVQIPKGKELSSSMFSVKKIPKKAYLKGRHIPASKIPLIETQKTIRDISKNSPILYDDLQNVSGSQADMAGYGEFVVAVKFQNSPLLAHLKPLDVIAIAALQNEQIKEETGNTEEGKKYRYRTEPRLSILFPYVKILDVSNGSVLVSEKPERALQLLSASQNLPLYPLLRRQDDLSNTSVGVGGSVSWRDLTVEKLSGQN